jgi:hypothetical protein
MPECLVELILKLPAPDGLATGAITCSQPPEEDHYPKPVMVAIQAQKVGNKYTGLYTATTGGTASRGWLALERTHGQVCDAGAGLMYTSNTCTCVWLHT